MLILILLCSVFINFVSISFNNNYDVDTFHVHQLYFYCNNNFKRSYSIRLATYILNIRSADVDVDADVDAISLVSITT